MKLEIRNARETDFEKLSELARKGKNKDDVKERKRFREILSSANQNILLGFIDGCLAATLSVSIIESILSSCPTAILSDAVIKNGYERIGLERAMIARAEYIAAQNGCKIIDCADNGNLY